MTENLIAKYINNMKILLVILLLVNSFLGISQDNKDIKKCIDEGELTNLPFINTDKNPSHPYYISEKYRKGLPVFVYDDMRGIIKKTEEDCAVRNQFLSTNGDFRIFHIGLGEYMSFRKLLATYDMDGNLISCLEVSYMFDPFGNFKQWKLHKDMTLETYTIKVLGEERVDPDPRNPFTELEAQRIDATYQIDSLGQFKKQKEIFYKPRIYPRAYFERDEYPIWEGDEEAKETKTY